MTHEKFMREAFIEAKRGGLPYGAVIVKNNKIVMRGYNTAQTDNDVSAHAELNILRAFTKQCSEIFLELNPFNFPCKALVAKGFQNVEIAEGILAEECLELFKQL